MHSGANEARRLEDQAQLERLARRAGLEDRDLTVIARVPLFAGLEASSLADVLAEDDADAFTLDVRGLRWREHSVDAATLGAVRRDLFVGYGSCSFDEPVADLAALGMFPGQS